MRIVLYVNKHINTCARPIRRIMRTCIIIFMLYDNSVQHPIRLVIHLSAEM